MASIEIRDLATAHSLFHHWQQRAHKLNLELRAPPPEPTTCCGRGCNGCVWDGFYFAAECWVDEAEYAVQSAAPST